MTCKKKPKIAMIVNSNIYSGLEKVTSEIMLDLRVDFDFIYVTKNGPVVDRFKELGLKYYLIGAVSVKEIKQFIKEWEPDIIHAHDFRASTIVALSGYNNLISHLHNNPLWIRKINSNSLAYLLFGIMVKKILIVSESVKNEFVFNKILNKKYKCIGNPLSRKNIIDSITSDLEKKYDLCCVGRVEEQKNPNRFLMVVKKLALSKPDIKACWVGEGSLKQQCVEYILENNLENNIEFLGYKKNPYQVMNQSRIFMLTSDWEGFGLVAFEALCLGVPCVVSKVGGLTNIVDDTCGYLCSNQQEFVDSVNKLLNDKILYEKMVHSAIEKSKKLDNRKEYMEEIAAIYCEMLGEK